VTLWKNIFVETPADQDTVWIVRIPFFDTPVQALFNEGNGTFEWVSVPDAVHNQISINDVFKWRPL